MIDQVTPSVPGVEVEVRNYDASSSWSQRRQHEVLIYGYEGEPYARMLADGTVQVNQRSPATYLNEDRYASVEGAGEGRPEGAAALEDGRRLRAPSSGTTTACTTWRPARRRR